MDLTLTQERVSVRFAQDQDRRQLANLIHFGTWVHRHLDWRSPLDWIGYQPYLVAEQDGNIVAALACPPDPPDVAWIRLFAVSSEMTVAQAWETLWPAAHEYLWGINLAAIPLQAWFRRLLASARFSHSHDVVMLAWENQDLPSIPLPENCTIRLMNYDDLAAVKILDGLAFGPIWQQSIDMLSTAFRQASFATVVEDQHGVVGYQISTSSSGGGHLARLAIHPRAQTRGIGYAILQDLLTQFKRRGAQRVTVNTQTDNAASLALYTKAGFYRTGEVYPVYEASLD